MAHSIACATMFLRGDVKESNDQYVENLTKKEGKAFPKEELGDVLFSDGRQIEWNREIPDRGMFIVRTENTKVFSGFPAGRTVDWGKGPMLTEGVPVKLKLKSKARYTSCWALDENGKRCRKVPVKRSDDGTAILEIGPEYKTIWYEIKVR